MIVQIHLDFDRVVTLFLFRSGKLVSTCKTNYSKYVNTEETRFEIPTQCFFTRERLIPHTVRTTDQLQKNSSTPLAHELMFILPHSFQLLNTLHTLISKQVIPYSPQPHLLYI